MSAPRKPRAKRAAKQEPPPVDFVTLADAGGMTVAIQDNGEIWFLDAADQEFFCVPPSHEGDA